MLFRSELAEYGECFLSRINGYPEIISHFRSLNSFAAGAVRAVLTEQEARRQTAKTEYVRTIEGKSIRQTDGSLPPWTTELALRAAIRLFAQNQDIADRAYRHSMKCQNSHL